ncbi:unnamed protein product [Onchocerca flexuosa]|uniref:Uncharacterized protein n=1 Tax=Onchocerca flexuosa TaxID=387005 RepID=A0A183I6H7_9BILA|nr:unnamed protein product [Onchocerca flexuosa]
MEDIDSNIMPYQQMQMPSTEEFDNINEELLKFNKSSKTEEKGDEIPGKKEKFPDSYIHKIDTATAESTFGSMIASDKQYIESHYNVDDLCQWNVY